MHQNFLWNFKKSDFTEDSNFLNDNIRVLSGAIEQFSIREFDPSHGVREGFLRKMIPETIKG